MASENNLVTVYDAATNETIVRPMTDEEQQINDAVIENEASRLKQQVAAIEARKEPLRKLGLTEDEINTVLGL